jgi:hypothetical protein
MASSAICAIVARRRARRSAHPGVVERHDSPVARQRVDQLGIPVVEVPAEVLVEHERRGPFADLAIRVVDGPCHLAAAVEVDELVSLGHLS